MLEINCRMAGQVTRGVIEQSSKSTLIYRSCFTTLNQRVGREPCFIVAVSTRLKAKRTEGAVLYRGAPSPFRKT